jgi:hypothetical protein
MCSPVYETSEESKPGVTPQLTKKMIVDFQPKVEGRIRITGCDILPDGKFVFAEQEKHLLQKIPILMKSPVSVQKGHN